MDKGIKDITNASDKITFKGPYLKKQVNFEQCLEASSALLSYFCMDELEYMQDVETHDSAVVKTIQKGKDKLGLLLEILQTPIVCSAADNFIFHFQESATLLFMCQGKKDFKEYLVVLQQMIENAVKKIYLILGTDDFDKLEKIPEKLNKVELCEPGASADKIQLFLQL